MANSNESTLKLKADISGLKQGIAEANRQIKLANSQFDAAASAMDDWNRSADGLTSKINQLETVYEQENRKLELLRQQYELTAQAYGANSREAENLQIKINRQQTVINNTARDIETYRSRLHDLETAASSAGNSVGNSGGAFEQLSAKIKEQENELAGLKDRYKEYVLSGDQASDEAQELARQIQELSGELNANRQRMSEADNAADELTDSLDDVGDGSESAVGGIDAFKVALGNLVSDGIKMAINAIKDFVKESLEIGKNFDAQMSKVGAISGATGEELEQLSEKAEEMGATTKFTATEAGQAFEYMAMAGWKPHEMLEGIDGVMSLAAASGEDLATTSDIVTDALTAFGYGAEDAGHFADVLAVASSNANTNVGMMGETFQYVAPVAGALGYTAEDVAESIGFMANAGIKSSNAGTTLRSIMTRLSTDAGASSKSLGALGTLTEKLGVQFYNADGSARDFNDVIEEARAAWQGLTDEEQTNYAKKIAGQNAISGWMALMNASADDVTKLEDALVNCDGAADAMAETMLDNLAGDMTLLDSKIEGIQLALYKKFEPALRTGAAALDKLADGLSWFIENGSPIIGIITSVGTAIGAFMIYLKREAIVTAFTAAITGVKTAFLGLNAVMAANPIGIVIAAVSALVAAFVYFWNTSEEFRNFWIGLWDEIQKTATKYIDAVVSAFTGVWDGIKEGAKAAGDYFSDVWSGVKEFFVGFWGEIQKTVTKYIDAVVSAFTGVWDYFSDLWSRVSGFIKLKSSLIEDFFLEIWDGIKKVFAPSVEFFEKIIRGIAEFYKAYINIIIGLAKGCWNIIKRVFEVVGEWFNKKVIQPVAKFFEKLWSDISDAAKSAWDAVSGAFKAAAGWFDTNVIQPVKNFFADLWDGISDAARKTWTAVSDAFKNAADWFGDKIITPVGDFFAGMWEGLKKGAADAWDGITSIFAVVADWFREKFTKAWEAVKNVFSAGGKIFDGIKEGIAETFKTVVNGLIEAMNRVISIPFNKINEMLNKIRNISILDIQPFADMWPEDPLAVPQIPQLARGGVLKRGQMALLEGRGAEAIVPLEKNILWIRKVAAEMEEGLEDALGLGKRTSRSNEIAGALESTNAILKEAQKNPVNIRSIADEVAGAVSGAIAFNDKISPKTASGSDKIVTAIDKTNAILASTQGITSDIYTGIGKNSDEIIRAIVSRSRSPVIDAAALANQLVNPMNAAFGRMIAQRGRA